MKYIDVDKLKAEIERQLSAHDKVDHLEAFEVGKAWNRGHRKALDNLLSFLDSFQQEQSEVDVEKAAEKAYPREVVYAPKSGSTIDLGVFLRKAFIAGARWQNHRELH